MPPRPQHSRTLAALFGSDIERGAILRCSAQILDFPRALIDGVAGRVVEHVGGAVWAAVRISAAAHRPNFRRRSEKLLRCFRLKQKIEVRNVDPPTWPTASLGAWTTPARSPEILLHRDAVGDAPDRTERQCAKAGQSSYMVADERQTTPMEFSAGVDIGGDLFAGSVIAKVSDFQPDRATRRIGKRCDNSAAFGGIPHHGHRDREGVDKIKFLAASRNLVSRPVHHGDVAAEPRIIGAVQEMRWTENLREAVVRGGFHNLCRAPSPLAAIKVGDVVVPL